MVYIKNDSNSDGHAFITLYVDDMLFFGNTKDMIHDLMSQLSKECNMKDLEATKYILEMDIRRDRKNINLGGARVSM